MNTELAQQSEVTDMAAQTSTGPGGKVSAQLTKLRKGGGGGRKETLEVDGQVFTEDYTTISVKELPDDLDYHYNSRAPSRKSKAYKAMMYTLEHEPEMFKLQNDGITVANGTHVLDGGHTYLALRDAKKAGWDLSAVRVTLKLLDGLSPEQMVKASIGLNNKVASPIIGQRELAGDWDDIKMALDKKYHKLYEFKPNSLDGDFFKVEFLVALLHGWWPGNSKVDRVYSTKGILVKLFNRDKYKPVTPLINEAIEFWSLIAKTIADQPQKELLKLRGIRKPGRMLLPNGEYLDARIPEAYVWLMYCAAGKLLNQSAEWTKDRDGMFKKSFRSMWKQLLADYKVYGQDPSSLGKAPDAYMRQMVALLAA